MACFPNKKPACREKKKTKADSFKTRTCCHHLLILKPVIINFFCLTQKKIFWTMFVNQTVESSHWPPQYSFSILNQWGPATVWLSTFFKICYFVFAEGKFGNNNNVNFGVSCSFKNHLRCAINKWMAIWIIHQGKLHLANIFRNVSFISCFGQESTEHKCLRDLKYNICLRGKATSIVA